MIAIHAEQSGSHDYLSKFWFMALLAYLQQRGIPVKLISNLDQARNDIVLTDCDFLSPEQVQRLKENNNTVVGFNLVDSSYISQVCRADPTGIDLIFSFTGIQTTNIGHELEIDGDFNPVLKEREFLPEEQWQRFDQMRREGRLLSLPYVHWERQPESARLPFEQRAPSVLIRGGAHMRRVVLALFLMRLGKLDSDSGFPLGDYFAATMDERFRFCADCQAHYWGERIYRHREEKCRKPDCTSPAEWGGELNLENMGLWNNRCPASFYWLAQKFAAHHGELNPQRVESLFNQKWQTPETALRMLGRVRFTSDLKWLHSIYAAQRFWDGAIAGTVNLLPSRTNDQVYFPALKEGEHYVTFKEDFSDLKQDTEIEQEKFEHITGNCYNLYSEWIRPTEFAVNTNLLQFITHRILQ